MKKLIPLLLMSVMVFILGSCTGNTGNDTDIPKDDEAVIADVTDSGENGEPETEPVSEPDELPTDDTTALANEIISKLESDMGLVRSILHLRETESVHVTEGVDQIGNLIYLDVTHSDGSVSAEPYVPFVEQYNTVEKCMEVMHRANTSEKCEKLYADYIENSRLIQEVDGKLYSAMADYVDDWFDMPIQSAEKISDGEIVAITTLTYHGNGESVPYEITLKTENDEWKVDKMLIIDYYGVGSHREEDC